jgi:hypothetical protein
MYRLYRFVQAGQDLESLPGHPRHHHSPVPGFAGAQDQAAFLEPIEETCDIGISGNHSAGNVLDWQNRVIFVPDSKTPEGRRLVPMSGRVFETLQYRCATGQEGWVFPSKRSASGHLRSICNLFRKARNKAGLPKELVLYCARHDYGTRVLMRTGNLAAVMRTIGHRDVKTAMHYQHPELEIVRAALDYRPPNAEAAAWRKEGYDTFCDTPKNHNLGKSLKILVHR